MKRVAVSIQGRTYDEIIEHTKQILEKAELERAKEIWKVVLTFPESIIKKSLIIDHIKDGAGKKYWKQELEKVASLTVEQKKTLGCIKGASAQKDAFEGMVM